jgi:trans-aconitate 2-methyltransferase
MESTQIKDFYDDFADRQKHTGVNKRHHVMLMIAREHGLLKGARILEIGCGIGTFTQLIAAEASGSSLLAVDISPASIEMARDRLKHLGNVECRVVDVIKDKLDGTFDTIVLPDVLEHIPLEQQPALFRKLKTCLSSGGRILIHSPDPYYLEWVQANKPELLQVVDIPLHLPRLMRELHEAGFTVDHFQRHRIWQDAPDYMAWIVSHQPVGFDYKEVLPAPKGIRGFLHRVKRRFS